ncbi:hypothetical protein AVEN_166477-1 [Araneus ventricosus]|uniref:Uncharacterized protein n=1 Tax=Araneus ventricosus TaxID=182803 RepID=A0A4Y2UT07_ARAVE|nr:hypothetical protein AVEN_40703-1 [Araneus ventricosus]GBO14680.1 hypothetical protein AVEN_166477-1 [Araneus ventricosus]
MMLRLRNRVSFDGECRKHIVFLADKRRRQKRSVDEIAYGRAVPGDLSGYKFVTPSANIRTTDNADLIDWQACNVTVPYQFS